MSIDKTKTDLILQFILLVAGQEEDYKDRRLGPIHLLKYVYLADLIYASSNEGQTFTGADWYFHNFGPWTQHVNERIEPALMCIGAQKQTFESRYEDKKDWYRWQISDDILYQETKDKIPVWIKAHLPVLIHTFGNSTPDLLHHVYLTPPMRQAAPSESLDFSLAVFSKEKVVDTPLREEQLSNKKKKNLKEKMRQLKDKLSAERSQDCSASRGLVDSLIESRYDDVYFEGLNWLESLAGDGLPEGTHTVSFREDVWKSSTRTSHDVS